MFENQKTHRRSVLSCLKWCIENTLLCVHRYALLAACQLVLKLPRCIHTMHWPSLNITAYWTSDDDG